VNASTSLRVEYDWQALQMNRGHACGGALNVGCGIAELPGRERYQAHYVASPPQGQHRAIAITTMGCTVQERVQRGTQFWFGSIHFKLAPHLIWRQILIELTGLESWSYVCPGSSTGSGPCCSQGDMQDAARRHRRCWRQTPPQQTRNQVSTYD
jgi:hypothetical protein